MLAAHVGAGRCGFNVVGIMRVLCTRSQAGVIRLGMHPAALLTNFDLDQSCDALFDRDELTLGIMVP